MKSTIKLDMVFDGTTKADVDTEMLLFTRRHNVEIEVNEDASHQQATIRGEEVDIVRMLVEYSSNIVDENGVRFNLEEFLMHLKSLKPDLEATSAEMLVDIDRLVLDAE